MRRRILGVRAVQEALAARASSIAVLYLHEEAASGTLRAIHVDAKNRAGPVELKSSAELDALAEGDRHQGVVALGADDYAYANYEQLLDAAIAGPGAGLIVALDEVTDPHNLGAIVRSSVAFGAHGVVTMKDRAAPVTAAAVRASAGATEHASIARVTNLARALEAARRAGFATVGLAAEGEQELRDVDLTRPTVLVVGSEGRGLRRLVRAQCDALARIPIPGAIASLNASVAASVALYEAVRQRTAR